MPTIATTSTTTPSKVAQGGQGQWQSSRQAMPMPGPLERPNQRSIQVGSVPLIVCYIRNRQARMDSKSKSATTA